MKKIICLFSLLCSSLWAQTIDLNGTPTLPLISLCEMLQVPHSDIKAWQQQEERWTFKEKFENRREEILPLLEKLGLFQEVRAQKSHYRYGVVLGGLAASVKKRIDFLAAEWDRGVRFDEVVFLTGERPLHKEKEREFLDRAHNETEMMQLIWKETAMPEELRARLVTIIHAPPLATRGRPTTESTVHEWLKVHPAHGSCLVFSSQPYVGYQYAILAAILPSGFTVETVGPEGGRTFSIAILLDTVAKQLQWECRCLR